MFLPDVTEMREHLTLFFGNLFCIVIGRIIGDNNLNVDACIQSPFQIIQSMSQEILTVERWNTDAQHNRGTLTCGRGIEQGIQRVDHILRAIILTCKGISTTTDLLSFGPVFGNKSTDGSQFGYGGKFEIMFAWYEITVHIRRKFLD